MCFHKFYSQYTKKSALLVVSALRRVPATSYTFSFRRFHGLSSNPMVSLFANGLSGCFCYSVHGQHRGLLAARHTCGKKQLSVWCVGAQINFFCANAPFGAVYTALRPALRQVQQVGCLLELLLELRAVPVGFSIVRRTSSQRERERERGNTHLPMRWSSALYFTG